MAPIASVLVVEDSRVQRERVAALCLELGVLQVHQAEHGADALDQLARLAPPPAALIIDLEMPVMDGVELIAQLRQRAIDIPFAVMSTREAPLLDAVEAMAQVQGLRVAHGLRKPVTATSLAQALRDCAATRADAEPGVAAAAPAIAPEALFAALEAGAIRPMFQPKVCVRTGVIRGVEALARWTDPVLGPVAPERFVAAAEQADLIHPLTMAILDRSFAQVAEWRAHGLVLPVAVNLSPRLLDAPALVEEIEALAVRHGLKPEQVVLELTETSVVRSLGTALGVLARLRIKGFGLSIDDYGTGFSSMLQLSRVPCTEVKIDRSFVDGAHRHEGRRAILQSAVEMAARLQVTSVAEGVESLEDWQLLQRFGCDVGQGWLFGRAMAGAELPGWLRRHALRLPELRADGSAA